MSGNIKFFGNGGENMSFMIEDDSVLVKYNEIWNKLKKILNINFHSMSVYDEKNIKAKEKEFNSVVNTNFWIDKVPKEGVNDTFIACISIDSVMKMEKKELCTSLFRRIEV